MTATSPVLTLDMLPQIRAVVRDRKALMSAGSLAGWGLFNLAMWVLSLGYIETIYRAIPHPGPLLFVVMYGVLGIAAAMLACALYGLVTRSPVTILLDCVVVGAVGVYNLMIPFLLVEALRQHGVEAQPEFRGVVLGVIQIAWGIREGLKYKSILAWSAEIAAVAPEQKKQTVAMLKTFSASDEDLIAGRVKTFIDETGFFSRSLHKGYRGQLHEGAAIFVSKRRDDCLVVAPEAARGATYHRKLPTVQIETDMGRRKFTLTPFSAVIFKRWAGVAVTERELKAAIRKGRPPADVLALFLADPSPSLRTVAVQGVVALKNDQAMPAVLERLGDGEPQVRQAALEACCQLRADGLHDRVCELLKDSSAPVRCSAAAYLASFPSFRASEALRTTARLEENSAARKQMDKALKACERARAT